VGAVETGTDVLGAENEDADASGSDRGAAIARPVVATVPKARPAQVAAVTRVRRARLTWVSFISERSKGDLSSRARSSGSSTLSRRRVGTGPECGCWFWTLSFRYLEDRWERRGRAAVGHVAFDRDSARHPREPESSRINLLTG